MAWVRQPGALVPLLIGLMPLWWATGLSEVIWPVFGVLMAGSLAQATSIAVPRYFSMWVIFVIVVVASGLMLEDELDMVSWFIRLSQYVSLGLVIPYVLTHRHTTPIERVVASCTALFAASVAGGWIGLVVGDWTFTAPLAWVLPGSIAANSFVDELVHPAFADIESFLGTYSVTRPKAPFTYTNGWGAAMGVLTPFALCSAVTGFGGLRRTARVALAASVVPIVFSLNQGLWVSLIALACYVAFRAFVRGDGRLIAQLLIMAVVAAVLIVVTPLGEALAPELQNPNATEDRFALYEATLRKLPESPVIGFGGPRDLDDTSSGPPAGTHGQLWIVLFSHGAAGALAYFGFLGAIFLRSVRYRTQPGLWASAVLFISFVQAPFYGHVPQQLVIIMAAGALALIDTSTPAAATTSSVTASGEAVAQSVE